MMTVDDQYVSWKSIIQDNKSYVKSLYDSKKKELKDLEYRTKELQNIVKALDKINIELNGDEE